MTVSPGKRRLAIRRANNRDFEPQVKVQLGFYRMPTGIVRFGASELKKDQGLCRAYTQAVLLAEREGERVRWQ